MVVGDLEFKIAGDEGRLWTRGALPKGTSRKCAQFAFRECMASCGSPTHTLGKQVVTLSVSEVSAMAVCVSCVLCRQLQRQIQHL